MQMVATMMIAIDESMRLIVVAIAVTGVSLVSAIGGAIDGACVVCGDRNRASCFRVCGSCRSQGVRDVDDVRDAGAVCDDGDDVMLRYVSRAVSGVSRRDLPSVYAGGGSGRRAEGWDSGSKTGARGVARHCHGRCARQSDKRGGSHVMMVNGHVECVDQEDRGC